MAAKPFDKYEVAGAIHWRLAETDPFYRLRMEALLSMVPTGGRCLDLGCGDGAMLGAASRRIGFGVGVEKSKLAVKLARSEFDARGIENVNMIWSEIKDAWPRLKGARFDVVWAMDVIEHMKAPNELVDLVSRAVHDWGTVLVGTPLWAGDANVSPYHVHEFRLEELLKLLSKRLVVQGVARLPDRLRTGSISPDRFAIVSLRRAP